MQHFKVYGLSQGLHIVSNDGTMHCDQIGKIGKLSFPVWYNNKLIASILSMLEVTKERRLTMDTSMDNADNAILIHCNDGRILKFVECAGGLYAHDRSNSNHTISTHNETP